MELDLRRRVLREPLGLSFTTSELEAEISDFHIGFFHLNDLQGCLILVPQSRTVIKMRQVAVEPEAQGQGIGRRLIEFAEDFSIRRGYREMILNAREQVVDFYKKLGYAAVGEPFDEVTIPHQKMKKDIYPAALYS